jgi:hypothetical protein
LLSTAGVYVRIEVSGGFADPGHDQLRRSDPASWLITGLLAVLWMPPSAAIATRQTRAVSRSWTYPCMRSMRASTNVW